MYRNEIMKCTGLSRKALDYYEEKGLITPMREENGYRIYEREDLEKLKKNLDLAPRLSPIILLRRILCIEMK